MDTNRLRAVWSRFSHYLRPYRLTLVGALCGALGVVATAILAPWPIKFIFDYILSDQEPTGPFARIFSWIGSDPMIALAWVCAAVLVIAAADALFSYFRDVLLAQTGQRVIGKIRQDLFAHLQTLSPSDFRRYHTGNLLTRLTRDIQLLREMLVNAVIMTSQSVLVIVAMITVMFWLNPTLALLGVATIPISIWASYRIGRQIRKATSKQREKESVVASVAHDVLGAMPIVQAFNREAIEQKRFARQNRSSIRAGVKTTRLEARLYRTVSLASAVGVCAILFVGVRAVLSGTMTAGDLLVFVQYLRSVNKPMRKLASLASRIAKATACGQRVAELFAIVPAIRNREGAVTLTDVQGRIDFEDVSFEYEPGAPVLSGVTISIEPGQRVAIVGETGSGKTTLAKLILRFYDTQQGAIRIDGIDVRDATLESLRSHIGWVHQDTVLFGMTIGQNIALGRPDAKRSAIRAMAKLVHAHEFTQAMPKGYDTVLGHDGDTLSGGQKQRIALARALLRKAPILILDEPAAALDAITRETVEQAWMSNDNRATTLVICHQLHAMNRFHRVLLLDKGRVVAFGAHDDLMKESDAYRNLIRHHDAATSNAVSQERAPC